LIQAPLQRWDVNNPQIDALVAWIAFPFLEDLFVPAFAENDQHADTGVKLTGENQWLKKTNME
jgi:hypothetical protein